MNVTLSRLCLAGLVCVVALTLVPINAGADISKDDQVIVQAYPVSDLPVWRYDSPIRTETGPDHIVRQLEDRPSGEPSFDATLLIAVIKASTGADAWKDGSIGVHQKSGSLVVRQTRAGHQKVADILTTFRGDISGEQRQEIDNGETNGVWVSPIGAAYDVAEAQDRGQSITISRIGGDFIFHLGATSGRSKNDAGIGFSIEPRLGHLRTSATQLSSLLGIR